MPCAAPAAAGAAVGAALADPRLLSRTRRRGARTRPPRKSRRDLLASLLAPIPRQSGRHILLWAAIKNDAESEEEIDRPAATSPFFLKMSIGLRRYRHFDSKSVKIAIGLRPCRLFDSKSLKISIGLRPYRLFDSKFQQACGNIAFLTQNVNRLAAISPF